jgi:hypothetical protein
MKASTSFCVLIVPALLLAPRPSEAQTRVRPYLNAGYITNLQRCSECEKADTGGSIRAGLLTRGRFGFYAGYLWFTEHHAPTIEYDDEGSGVLAGLDVRFLERGSLQAYAKLGLLIEKFTSTYPGRTESETSPKPDLGVMLHVGHFNTYLGWQPSDPPHINLGVGVTR